jgi:hypothetical protein
VVPISVWFDLKTPQGKKTDNRVVGTGFLIDRKGDFITAGHVLDELERAQKTPNVTRANLSAVIRQRNDNGSGRERRSPMRKLSDTPVSVANFVSMMGLVKCPGIPCRFSKLNLKRGQCALRAPATNKGYDFKRLPFSANGSLLALQAVKQSEFLPASGRAFAITSPHFCAASSFSRKSRV